MGTAFCNVESHIPELSNLYLSLHIGIMAWTKKPYLGFTGGWLTFWVSVSYSPDDVFTMGC